MGKVSDEFMKLSHLVMDESIVITQHTEEDYLDAGPIYIRPLNVNGWCNREVDTRHLLRKVKETAEEIKAEYNRAVEAGKKRFEQDLLSSRNCREVAVTTPKIEMGVLQGPSEQAEKLIKTKTKEFHILADNDNDENVTR